MSTDYLLYVGPYLRCTFTPVTEKVMVRTCPNEDCLKHGVEFVAVYTFCPLCGARVKHVAVKRTVTPPDIQTLYETIEESLTQAEAVRGNVHNWFPNRYKNAPRQMAFDPIIDSGEVYPLGDEESEKAWFHEAFSQEVEIFQDAYDEVELAWGIILDAF